MTPDEVEVLLRRTPQLQPSPELRTQVLRDIARRVRKLRPETRFGERLSSRWTSRWGAVMLASSLAIFGAVVWVILPVREAAPVRPESRFSEVEGAGTKERPSGPSPFTLMWQMKLAGGDLSRLVTMGDTLLAWEGPGFKMTAADRTSGKVLWKFELQNAPVPEWPPTTPEGVFSDLRHLEADLRRLNHRIDALLREKGVGPETQAVQSQRNDLRELLRQKALGDNLYLVSGQDLFSIDRRSGGLRWKKPLGFLPSARPVASQDRVFVVDGSSQQVRVYSVQHQGDEMTPIPGPVVGGLAYSDPLLSFVGRDGFVHAHKGTDGTLVWKEEIKGKVTSPPAVALARRAAIPGRPPGTITRLLLVPAGRMLYAFDQDAGVLLWKVECSSEITSVPIWAGDTLYLKTADQNLIALELLPERAGQIEVAGRLRWKLPGGERILLRGRDLVYVLATEPEVIGVRALTGEPVSRFSLGSFRDVATNLEDGMLYVARPGGWVEALLEIP